MNNHQNRQLLHQQIEVAPTLHPTSSTSSSIPPATTQSTLGSSPIIPPHTIKNSICNDVQESADQLQTIQQNHNTGDTKFLMHLGNFITTSDNNCEERECKIHSARLDWFQCHDKSKSY